MGTLFGGSIGLCGMEGVLPSRLAAREEMNCFPSQLRSSDTSDGAVIGGRR